MPEFQYFATLTGRGRGEGRLGFLKGEAGSGVGLGWGSELVGLVWLGMLGGFWVLGVKWSIIWGMDAGRILSIWAGMIGVFLVIVALLLVTGVLSIEIDMEDDGYFGHDDDDEEDDEGRGGRLQG